MRFAIYVRDGDTRYDAIDQVPDQLRTRTLAVRAFDVDAMIDRMRSWSTAVKSSAAIQRAVRRSPKAAYLARPLLRLLAADAAQVERAERSPEMSTPASEKIMLQQKATRTDEYEGGAPVS